MIRTAVLHWFVLAAVCLGFPGLVAAQAEAESTIQTPDQIAAESSRLFQEAAESIDSDRAVAIERIEQSIGLLESLIENHGIENASVHYNIANAYALADRYGRAIEHYRLASALDPRDTEVQANLAYARSRVPDRLGGPFERSATRRALDAVPFQLRVWLGLLALAGVWGLLIARAALAGRAEGVTDDGDEVVRTPVPLLPIFGAGAIAVLFGITVTLDALWPTSTFGVVADAPAVARQGPSEAAYDPAFARPLSPGVEFRVLEIRDGIDAPDAWVLAEFGDSRRGWFRRSSVVLVGAD